MKLLGKSMAILALILGYCSFYVQAQNKTIIYYAYGKVYDAGSKKHYYTNIFSFKVDEDHSSHQANLAVSRLESRFYSYIYNATASRYLTKSAFYYTTRTEAEEERDRKMNLNTSGGEKAVISIYFSWRFNKDE